jgi:hypothetical protein
MLAGAKWLFWPGRAACACNATVVMSDLDNECPGPDGHWDTREKEKGQASTRPVLALLLPGLRAAAGALRLRWPAASTGSVDAAG